MTAEELRCEMNRSVRHRKLVLNAESNPAIEEKLDRLRRAEYGEFPPLRDSIGVEL
jgi:hypothetical protein